MRDGNSNALVGGGGAGDDKTPFISRKLRAHFKFITSCSV
jgi:hypothetical protein